MGADNSKRSWDLAVVLGVNVIKHWLEAPWLSGGRGALILEEGVIAGSSK